MRDSGLAPLVLFGVLTVGTVSGVLLALSAGGLSLWGATGLTVSDGDLAEAAIGQPSGGDPDPAPEAGAQPTTTIDVDPTSTSLQLVPTSAPGPEHELWTTTVADPADLASDDGDLLSNGVFASPNPSSRLASFLIHDGLVVTSAAAVDGRNALWLRLDGRWVSASPAMADPYTDIAVLATTNPLPDDLPPLVVSDDQLLPGSPVAVAFTPTGHRTSHEAGPSGYVAAVDNQVTTSLNRHCYVAFTTSVLSTGTPAGSAVTDRDGAVIGMTISTQEATVAAVPMATVAAVARAMIDRGSPASGWLGVEAVADTDGRTRIVEVVPAGPAAAVLQADDVIVSFDGRRVENPDHLVHLVRGIEPGVDVEVVIERHGTTESVNIRPASVLATS